MMFHHARGELSLDRCRIMGIVNRTPDSFYDGGRMSLDSTVDHALSLVDQGADVLDLGAVKAGPGAPVSEEEELSRLLPVVERLATATDAPVSVETARSEVARRAFECGAAILNDVSGLADLQLAEVCAQAAAGIVLMHHGGQIRGRPRHPQYRDVVAEIAGELNNSADVALATGVAKGAIMVDPGLDFGKNTFHSLELVKRLEELTEGRYPVLVAASRKDVVGETLDLPPPERLEGSLAIAVMAVGAGVAMVRVHDVEATRRAVAMTEAVLGRSVPLAPVRGLWE